MAYPLYELNDSISDKFFKISSISTSNLHHMKNMHTHKHYEIAHFNNIDKTPFIRHAYTENNKYTITPFSIALFPPDLKHKIVTIKNTYLERTLINIRPHYINPIAKYLNIDIENLFSHIVLHFSEAQITELRKIMKQMEIELRKNSNLEENIGLKLLFTNFLYTLNNAKQFAIPENSDENQIKSVINHIQHNYSDDLTLENLSNIFSVSKYELCRKIKSFTGTNFSLYLNQIRINHSRKLIENSSMTLTEIAEYVGYSTAAHFSTTFKKITGISPNDYKKNIKKQQ